MIGFAKKHKILIEVLLVLGTYVVSILFFFSSLSENVKANSNKIIEVEKTVSRKFEIIQNKLDAIHTDIGVLKGKVDSNGRE